MKKTYSYLMFLLILLTIGCEVDKKAETYFVFYNSNGKVLKTISLLEVKNVNWKDQCYKFNAFLIEELNKLDLEYGKVDLVFENQILISAETYNILYAYLPNDYFIILDEHGKIVFEENHLCFANSLEKIGELLKNERYFKFLNENNLFKE